MTLSKEQKKAMLQAWKEKQKKVYILKKREARSLFGSITREIGKQGCDHTLRFTRAWLEKKYEDEGLRARILAEINEDGGGCDCEVILNCYERYELDY